eukprot:gnl/Dysnectes_brevis/8896_a16155_268.p1 GENE.gnl/Dysnectes_brevis/8896_a16155_268~~gnl/Dysnectes_brevis/8896_a16155_268.p1  ORF type:complete len:522 (+),score=31.51 gnl/Dysnectes_brevis/8896_a16155_268:33-1598(+)
MTTLSLLAHEVLGPIADSLRPLSFHHLFLLPFRGLNSFSLDKLGITSMSYQFNTLYALDGAEYRLYSGESLLSHILQSRAMISEVTETYESETDYLEAMFASSHRESSNIISLLPTKEGGTPQISIQNQNQSQDGVAGGVIDIIAQPNSQSILQTPLSINNSAIMDSSGRGAIWDLNTQQCVRYLGRSHQAGVIRQSNLPTLKSINTSCSHQHLLLMSGGTQGGSPLLLIDTRTQSPPVQLGTGSGWSTADSSAILRLSTTSSTSNCSLDVLDIRAPTQSLKRIALPTKPLLIYPDTTVSRRIWHCSPTPTVLEQPRSILSCIDIPTNTTVKTQHLCARPASGQQTLALSSFGSLVFTTGSHLHSQPANWSPPHPALTSPPNIPSSLQDTLLMNTRERADARRRLLSWATSRAEAADMRGCSPEEEAVKRSEMASKLFSALWARKNGRNSGIDIDVYTDLRRRRRSRRSKGGVLFQHDTRRSSTVCRDWEMSVDTVLAAPEHTGMGVTFVGTSSGELMVTW